MEDKLEQLRIAAESGDMNAMCEYGKKLAKNRDFDDALKWHDLSNDDVALDVLATCLYAGNGIDKNIKESVSYFLRAVELGEIDRVVPIFLISHIFDDHINFGEVVSVLEKLNNTFSIDNAGADAIKFYNLLRFMLASCYYWGVGTKQNKERAKQLLMSAGYDFDMDTTPLLIKEIAMAYTFPNQFPICRDFFIPLLKNYFWLDTNKPFRTYYPYLKKYNLSEYSKTQDIYKFLIEQDDTNRWYYLQVASEKNANRMYDALKEGNYDKFSNACLDEPNFAECVFLYNKLKTNFQHSNYLPPFYCLDSVFEEDGDIDENLHPYKSLLLIILISYSFNKSNLTISISSFIFSITQSIFACFLILSIINESKIASNLTDSEDEKYKELTKLLNHPKFSDELYEFKDYCRNTPSIFEGFEFTKEELSSIFGIVEIRKEENPDDIDEAPLSVPPSSNDNSLSLTKTPTNIITKEDMNAFCVAFASHCIPNNPEAIKFFFWSTGKPVCSTIQWRSTIRLFVAFLHYAYKGLDLPIDTENMVKKIFYSKKGKPITIAGYGIDKYEELLKTVEIEINQVK